MATLTTRYHVSVPGPAEAFPIDRAAIYAGVPHHPEDPANLFRIAIAFEERAAAFFAQRSAAAGGSPVVAQLYKELAAEEEEHATLLVTELERWKAGKPGLL